jgi:hypothetical protein
MPQNDLPEPVTSPKGVPGELLPLASTMQRLVMSPTNAQLAAAGHPVNENPASNLNRNNLVNQLHPDPRDKKSAQGTRAQNNKPA